LENNEVAAWPAFVPNSRVILFAGGNSGTFGRWDSAVIVALSLDTGQRQIVAQGGTSPRFASSGHVVFARSGSLLAIGFDPDGLMPVGSAVPVLEGVLSSSGSGWAQFGFSDKGTLIYLPRTAGAVARTLVWVDRQGTVQPVSAPARAYEEPRLSPDGQRVALTIREEDADIWILDLVRGVPTRLTFEAGEDESPVWTPDGRQVTFAGSRTTGRATLLKLADGSRPEEPLFTPQGHQHIASWSPDGEALVYDEGLTTGNDIVVAPGKGKDKARSFLNSNFNEWAAQLSADGRWIAYTSNESGRNEVYVRTFPDPGGRWQISTDGGDEPVWSRNGRELYYRNGDKMMAVPIQTTPTFTAGAPKTLFEGQFTRLGWLRANYDVSRDGRFLMIKGEEQPFPTTINLVLNWFSEMTNRVR
jgi:serine/threonine-protein kinase